MTSIKRLDTTYNRALEDSHKLDVAVSTVDSGDLYQLNVLRARVISTHFKYDSTLPHIKAKSLRERMTYQIAAIDAHINKLFTPGVCSMGNDILDEIHAAIEDRSSDAGKAFRSHVIQAATYGISCINLRFSGGEMSLDPATAPFIYPDNED